VKRIRGRKRQQVVVGVPDRALTPNAGMTAVTGLCDRLDVAAELRDPVLREDPHRRGQARIGDAEVTDHQVIFRAGQAEAVVVPLEEYRALKALEQREAELYWVAHESRYPSRPGDDVPDGKVYDSMEALVADLGAGE
jgi:hypothetical protein